MGAGTLNIKAEGPTALYNGLSHFLRSKMNDPKPVSDDDALTLIDLRSILDWLATPQAARAEDELAPLHTHLTALRGTQTAAHQRHKVLDLLYTRAHGTVGRLLPELACASLPLSRRTRQTVRGTQELLLMVAEDYLNTFGDLDEHLIKGLRRPLELTLWRAIDALATHLLISNYVAAPAASGIWQLLHRAYRIAADNNVADLSVLGEDGTPEEIYLRALLLSCAQPASFTSREIDLIVEYTRRFGNRAGIVAAGKHADGEGLFWVDLDRDASPTAASRQPAPEGVLRFSCDSLAELVEEQVDALEAGAVPIEIDLPEAAATATGHGALRRLAHYWGHPGKRRFPRRRQNYRAVLCVGLQTLWQLFHEEESLASELTHWMVTNESPDGYALMHVSGKTAHLAAGDIVAVRTENAEGWQICIARWALSENPEHLELGLQILATSATPAILACGKGESGAIQQSALILPQLLPVRPLETVVVPTGTAAPGENKMVLLIERENLEVREVIATHLEEQTASVEVLSIRPSTEP
jgi:hypothetical protein